MTCLHSSIRRHQDCQILPDFLRFEVLICCCLKLHNIILEIFRTCQVYKRVKGSINGLKTSLKKSFWYALNIYSPISKPTL